MALELLLIIIDANGSGSVICIRLTIMPIKMRNCIGKLCNKYYPANRRIESYYIEIAGKLLS